MHVKKKESSSHTRNIFATTNKKYKYYIIYKTIKIQKQTNSYKEWMNKSYRDILSGL